MLFPPFVKRRFRVSFFYVSFAVCLFASLFSLAQVTLKYRMIAGYFLSSDAPTNRDKPTLFVFEKAESFGQAFRPAATMDKRPDVINFGKEMAVGVALPPSNKPPKLSISKVFVQDSILTVRYIRLIDTTLIKNPQSFTTQPLLLLAIPAQTVLKTRLIENGRVVLTTHKSDEN